MRQYFAAYASALSAMLALDALWLGVIAKPIYRHAIGHLMAERPNFVVAALFYAVYSLGLMVFVLVPYGADVQWSRTLATAALFGFFTYATYDLTNLATLKNWPTSLALVDIAWGCLVSAACAACGRIALAQFTLN